MLISSLETSNLEVITPEVAVKYYAKSAGNRNIRWTKVDQYVLDMLDGKWLVTGDGITFNEYGELVQGHHRLLACIKANTPFKTFVVRNVSAGANIAMDTGMTRSLADYLTYAGYKNVTQLAASITSCWRWENSLHTNKNVTQPTRQQAMAWLSENPEIVDIIPVTNVVTSSPIKFRVSVSGPLMFVASRLEPDLWQNFVREIQTGDSDLQTGSRTLREWLIRQGDKQHISVSNVKMLAVAIKSWNYWVSGEPISILKWNAGGSKEAFPRMIDSEGNFDKVYR